jgi:ribosomal protein L7/L12
MARVRGTEPAGRRNPRGGVARSGGERRSVVYAARMAAWFRKKKTEEEPLRLSGDLEDEVRRLKVDDRVAAVKLVRDRTGAGLTVAVRAVDAVE